MTTFRCLIALLACVYLGACGGDPPPRSKTAAEYLASIQRDPRLAAVRVFVAPPIIKNDQWADDEVQRIVRTAVSDALGAMGFAMVGMDNDADAIARIRVVVNQQTQVSTYELELTKGGFDIETFRLEDTSGESNAGLARDERVRRVYTRMIAARAPTIVRSPRIAALVQKRAADQAAAASASAKPDAGPPPPPVATAPPSAAEREKAIAWIQSTLKAGASAPAVTTFTRQLDEVIAAGKDGQWQLGWGVTKDNMARVARWRAGAFETRAITPVEGSQLGLNESSSTFTTQARGSLLPLGPNSAPPPPTAPPPPPPPLPPNTETGNGRAAAVAWVNAHAKGGQTVTSLIEQIDDVIKAGTRGEWKLGWGLTQNGKAYFIGFAADGAFQATELSVADAQAQGYKAYAVTYAKY